jgi:hypothetical protein
LGAGDEELLVDAAVMMLFASAAEASSLQRPIQGPGFMPELRVGAGEINAPHVETGAPLTDFYLEHGLILKRVFCSVAPAYPTTGKTAAPTTPGL